MPYKSDVMPYKYGLWLALFLAIFLIANDAMATTAGGGLPFDSWFTKIQKSVTGPFALTAAIIGMVSAGAGLIFGSELNAFMRTLLVIVLVLSFLVCAPNTISVITGKGTEISHTSENTKKKAVLP